MAGSELKVQKGTRLFCNEICKKKVFGLYAVVLVISNDGFRVIALGFGNFLRVLYYYCVIRLTFVSTRDRQE